MSEINTQIAKATKWSSITELISKLVSPITNMLLARILVPEAFGAVATINMVISFAELYTDAGFQKYIIQHAFANEEELNRSTNVAFWTNFGISGVVWFAIAVFRDPIAKLAGNSNLGMGVAVASLAIMIHSFSSIQMARLRREFEFKALFFVRMVAAFIPLAVTVPLAVVLRNYWALIIGTLCSQIVQALILFKYSVWKPNMQYSVECLKEMFSYTMWTMLESISIWLTSYIGTFIVGNALEAYYLGLYKTTINTVNAYMAIITAATTPVLFSALSRLQDNEEEYREVFFKFQRMVAMFVLPMGVGIYLYRELVTRILLGEQWMETAGFIGMWGLTSGITVIFSHYNSEVFRSKGRPRLSLAVQLLHLAALVPTLIWAVDKGFYTLYMARALVRFQMIFVSGIALWAVFKIKPWEVLKNVFPTIVATVVMLCFAISVKEIYTGVVWEFISIVLCVIVYFGIIMLIPKTRKEVWPIVYKVLGRFIRKKK